MELVLKWVRYKVQTAACVGVSQNRWQELICVSLNLYHCDLIIDASFRMRQKLSGIIKIDEQFF